MNETTKTPSSLSRLRYALQTYREIKQFFKQLQSNELLKSKDLVNIDRKAVTAMRNDVHVITTGVKLVKVSLENSTVFRVFATLIFLIYVALVFVTYFIANMLFATNLYAVAFVIAFMLLAELTVKAYVSDVGIFFETCTSMFRTVSELEMALRESDTINKIKNNHEKTQPYHDDIKSFVDKSVLVKNGDHDLSTNREEKTARKPPVLNRRKKE